MSLSRITSASIANSAISAADIADGTITAAKIISVANTQITGNIVSSQIAPSIVLNTPALGTPASGVLTNCTGVAAAALPAGSVLQVVQGTTSTLVTNSTTTYADTGLTATITPRSTSSKILVFVTMSGLEKSTGNTNNSHGFKLLRDATLVSEYAQYIGYTGSAFTLISGHPFNYLDSPSSTSALVYKVQFKNMTASAIIYCQANSNVSTITLMEIQG